MFLNTVKRIWLRQEERQGENLLAYWIEMRWWRLCCNEGGMISALMD